MRNNRPGKDAPEPRSDFLLPAAILGGCLVLAAVLAWAILASSSRRPEVAEPKSREGPKPAVERPVTPLAPPKPTAAEEADLALLRQSWNTVGDRILQTPPSVHPGEWDDAGVRMPGVADDEAWTGAVLTVVTVLAKNSMAAGQSRMLDLAIPVRGGGSFTLREKVSELSTPDHLWRWKTNPLTLHSLDDLAYRLKVGPWKPSPAGSPFRPDYDFYLNQAPGWGGRD